MGGIAKPTKMNETKLCFFPDQVAIDTVQESGISWEQYRKSVYGFLDENQDDGDEMRAEHEER